MTGGEHASPGPVPATRQPRAALVVEGLTKAYRRGAETVHALRGVDLSVPAGQLMVLLGRSGSGKTTLLNCVAGWETPDRGVVRLPRAAGAVTDWQQVAVVPQRFGLLPELTLAENVALPARLAHLPDPAAAARELLLALEVDRLADRLPDEVSLGEQQRTALARALVVRPRLLLADEPTGRLDEELSGRVLVVLGQLCGEHDTAALIASHDPVAVDHASRVVQLHDGRVREQGDAGTGGRPVRRPEPW